MSKVNYYKFCLILCVLACIPVFRVSAKSPYTPKIVDPIKESWRWNHYHELDGKGVKSITEGEDGSVWFASNEGVIRYDGYYWKTFKEADGISGFPVNDVLGSYNGNIYATTQNGIYYYDGNRWNNLFYDESGTFEFGSFNETQTKQIFCIMNNGFIRIARNNKLTFYTDSFTIPKYQSKFVHINWIELPNELKLNNKNNFVTDIIEDDLRNIWVAVTIYEEGKILKFRLEGNAEALVNYRILHNTQRLPLGFNQRFLKASNGDIWIICGWYNIGINRISGNKITYYQPSEIFGGDDFHSNIIETQSGEILVGGLGRIFTFKNGKWNYYTHPDIPIPTSCRVIFKEMTDGILWIGGLQNEIYKVDYSFNTWLTYEDLIFQSESSDCKYFISIDGKLVVNRQGNWTSYGIEDGLIDTPVRLIHTSKNQVWIVGSHNGFAATAYMDGDKFQKQLHPKLSWGIDYRAVYEAQDGSIWFGCAVDVQEDKGQLSGVLHLLNPLNEDKIWEHYHLDDGITIKNAYGIGQSIDGRLWLGGSYLMNFNGRSWAEEKEPSELNQFINTIYSKKNGILCVGSRYYGLFIFDGVNWTQHSTNNGLMSNTIISIFYDSPDNIWMATDNDICRFNGQEWAVNIFPEKLTMTNEGGSIFKDSEGGIWINKAPREWKRRAFKFNKTLPSSFDDFKTYRYVPDTSKPIVTIEDYPDKIAKSGQLILFWQGEDFFEHTPKDRLSYSYRINEGQWSNYSTETNHTFTDLKPGEYTFEVKVRDLDLNESTIPSEANFTILPPVWRQPWFVFLILSFIIAIVYFIIQIIIRERQLIKINTSLNDANTALGKQKEEIAEQNSTLVKMVDKVEKLSNSKLQFYTNISHEFRTPLTLILGNIEIIKNNEIDTDKQNKLVNTIRKNAYRLLTLINQILEFRKIESGTLKFVPRKGDLNLFLYELVNLFQSLADQKNISLNYHDDCEKLKTYFDHDKVEKIIFNLLSNAFKHTPPGGEINVNLSTEILNQENSKGLQYKIIVSDTGKGIPEKHIQYIFDRFYQAKDNDNKDIYRTSTGIGLSYIKDLIDIHKGQISVESLFSRGTKFILYIPVITNYSENNGEVYDEFPVNMMFSEHLQNSIQEISDSLSSKPVTQNIEINEESLLPKNSDNEPPLLLIIEDEDDMREFIKSVLINKYRIIESNNAREGLKLIKEYDFDLIVSDIMMPEMDGLEFCEIVKNDIATSHIPIILLTARTYDENKIDGFESGADDYITKPFNGELLEARIKNIINIRKKIHVKFSNDFALEPPEIVLPSADEKFLKDLITLIEANVSEVEFNVEKMAKDMCISRTHFIRKVKKLTGEKPTDLLKNYRLKRAKQLLVQDKIPISDVAYRVGYDNPGSFSRAFKQKFNLSPSEFLKTNA